MGFLSRLGKKSQFQTQSQFQTANLSPQSTASTLIPSPASPSPSLSSRSFRAAGQGYHTPSPPLSPPAPTIRLRVVIDGIGAGFGGHDLFYINVSAEDGAGAVRREIARVVGHSCMTLFKVSIPCNAYAQARTYTERYNKPVDLLATFEAFSLDDPAQLRPSLPPVWRDAAETAVESGQVTMKDWFPEQSSNDSETITVLARPAPDACLLNPVPLTLRAFIPAPSPDQSRSHAAAPPRPLPLVLDITPYITVDELKIEILRSLGKDVTGGRHVTLWQIVMTEKEMVVIDNLGRLKGGKMPWPYPPCAMEPIPMSDGNLPVCLFFPKSAPFGDMLDMSVWIDPAVDDGLRPTLGLGSTSSATDIPPFRYPMPQFSPSKRPASISDSSQVPLLDLTLSPSLSSSRSPLPAVFSLPAETPIAADFALRPKKGSRIRMRPSTAPAAVAEPDQPAAKAHAFGSRSAHPLRSVHTNVALPVPASRTASRRSTGANTNLGLGLTTVSPSAHAPDQADKRQIGSGTATSEDEGEGSSTPSLDSSRASLSRVDSAPPIRTPEVEKVGFFSSPNPDSADSASVPLQAHVKTGSFSSRFRRGRPGTAA